MYAKRQGGFTMADDNADNVIDETSEDKVKPKTKAKSKEESNDNTVYIGRKPTMNYVLAVVTQFNSGSDTVVIKARGKSISRAVDVAEIVRNRFVQDAEIKDIQISTETMEREEGSQANVSSMEIYMTKPQA